MNAHRPDSLISMSASMDEDGMCCIAILLCLMCPLKYCLLRSMNFHFFDVPVLLATRMADWSSTSSGVGLVLRI